MFQMTNSESQTDDSYLIRIQTEIEALKAQLAGSRDRNKELESINRDLKSQVDNHQEEIDNVNLELRN